MIEYSGSIGDLTAESLNGGFFEGWPGTPAPETHLKVLQGSNYVIVARDGTAVVGFINALSDGGFMAYIPLLEVLPAYRNRGIARELVERMLEALEGHYHIALLCDPDVQPMYERFGLTRVPGMVQVNLERQAGTPA
jgi:ribosomal protein S18 acetylase RimI-like enzyme